MFPSPSPAPPCKLSGWNSSSELSEHLEVWPAVAWSPLVPRRGPGVQQRLHLGPPLVRSVWTVLFSPTGSKRTKGQSPPQCHRLNSAAFKSSLSGTLLLQPELPLPVARRLERAFCKPLFASSGRASPSPRQHSGSQWQSTLPFMSIIAPKR